MSNIKEIWVMPHSHLDVGFTHPQHMILQLQCDYIDQAIDLIEATKDYPEEARFHWCCEATWPVKLWFAHAPEHRKALFRSQVKEGRMTVCAMPLHLTPNCSATQLAEAFRELKEIRALTQDPVDIAISHDVNGQPWTIVPLLKDAGISFYLTGLNIHFGGIPFPRPYAFAWEGPDGRSLPTFLGEHYSLFSQLFFTDEGSTARMHEGIQTYIRRMEEKGWQEDYVFLTATNPPLLDNNSPDAFLPDLVRRYNEEGHEQIIRIVSPRMLMQRVLQNKDALKRERGDWTDYWNFGCASMAREQKINRKGKTLLQNACFLAAFSETERCAREEAALARARSMQLLFDEHTWGAWECETDPDNEESEAQIITKRAMALEGAELSAYVLGKEIERQTGNEAQADGIQGIWACNPTGEKRWHTIRMPKTKDRKGRTLAALRIREQLPYERETKPETTYLGTVSLEPFSVRTIPYDRLLAGAYRTKNACVLSGHRIETPFYLVELDEKTGWIRQITLRGNGRRCLDETADWRFFDVVTERVDPRYRTDGRRALFSKDVAKVNTDQTQWQHGWKAVRSGICKSALMTVTDTGDGIALCYESETDDLKRLRQTISFSSVSGEIGLDISFIRQQHREPEGIYLAFPLRLQEGWQCEYDTADTFTKLDDDQLGRCCRDYLTVGTGISLYHETGGCTLACPDAPMVMPNGFTFGREGNMVSRSENPLLLAWPMNNYWDTNFPISEEGRLSFHYALTFYEEYDRAAASRFLTLAAHPVVTADLVHCREDQERTLITLKGENCRILSVDADSRDIRVSLQNTGNTSTSAVVTIPGRSIAAAWKVDLTGSGQEELPCGNDGVCIDLGAGELCFLRLLL